MPIEIFVQPIEMGCYQASYKVELHGLTMHQNIKAKSSKKIAVDSDSDSVDESDKIRKVYTDKTRSGHYVKLNKQQDEKLKLR